MEKRLRIARNLLTDDGVLFISIDDNEHYNLKLICDNVFGEKNFITDFVWLNNLKGRQISNGGAVKTYENILLYSKNIELINAFKGDIRELSEEMPLIYRESKYKVLKDKKGEYIIKNELYNSNGMFNEETRPNLVYNLFYNEKTRKVRITDVDDCDMPNKTDKGFVLITPHSNSDGIHRFHAWRWSAKKVLQDIEDLHFVKYEKTYKVYTKIRDMFTTNIKNIITDSTNGNNELIQIIGKGRFDFPKPTKLIKRLIQSYETSRINNKNLVILDFFAGSGTTGHAVMQLNKEDGGNRKYILCTNNENNICKEVTYQRLKNIQKDLPHNLKYYKTDFISRESDDISDSLLKHVQEMIQLEYAIKIDNKEYIMLLTDKEADNLENNWNKINQPKAIFIASEVLLSGKQTKLFNEVPIYRIPDYYFDFELKEVGEIL